ncbi:MAG TPA: hypothetical protein VK919_11965 [Solirubrobacterales bacterium]|nr:hypothetical protein [Solirubrobacterales bacterium]
MIELKPWMLPLIVVAIVVPLIAGLVLLGPQGMLLAALVVGIAIVLIVARPGRGRRIEVAPGGDRRHHLLIVAAAAIDSPRFAERIARRAEEAAGEGTAPDVLVLSPALNPMLHHWAVDVADARARAQARVETSLARLARAGIDARGSVGDSNPMLAIEDALRDFPADEVLVVADEELASDLASELGERLDRPVEAVAVLPDPELEPGS